MRIHIKKSLIPDLRLKAQWKSSIKWALARWVQKQKPCQDIRNTNTKRWGVPWTVIRRLSISGRKYSISSSHFLRGNRPTTTTTRPYGNILLSRTIRVRSRRNQPQLSLSLSPFLQHLSTDYPSSTTTWALAVRRSSTMGCVVAYLDYIYISPYIGCILPISCRCVYFAS